MHKCPALKYYGTGELDEVLDTLLASGASSGD
jgi:hypothetical protein